MQIYNQFIISPNNLAENQKISLAIQVQASFSFPLNAPFYKSNPSNPASNIIEANSIPEIRRTPASSASFIAFRL